LLVGMDGHVKVVDFGIMKAAGKRSNTLTGQLRGKLSYMSPEQARGKDIDHRTDLFALGAVLWELCTNERLFEAATESETLELVTRCRVPNIADFRPDLPSGLADILRQTLARDADDRYDSAQQMLRDIRALQRELDIEVDPRADLSEVMAQFFTARIEYVRAAVRRREHGGARSAGASSSSSASMEPPESAANGDATSVISSPRGHASGLTSRSDEPAEQRVQTNTITTALAAGPARHWSLWLVLPLVGAAIGTAVVGWGNRDRASDAAPAQVTQTERKPKPVEATPMTAVQKDDPRPLVAETVTWSINTDPQGASVTIDGELLDGRTPLDLTLDKGKDSVLIEVQLDGFRKRVARLAPLETDNLNYKLTASTPDGPTAIERPPPRLTGKRPRPGESAATGSDHATGTTPDKTDDDDPDFEGLLGQPGASDKPH
jgi:serine/threonine-protein kinase